MRFRAVIAVLLAALWLPATLHCGLESIAVWDAHSDDHGCATQCSTGADACAQDTCAVVEAGEYRPTDSALKVFAPQILVIGSPTLELLLAASDPAAEVETRAAEERPRDWLASWAFVRRVAPSPRAPSFLA